MQGASEDTEGQFSYRTIRRFCNYQVSPFRNRFMEGLSAKVLLAANEIQTRDQFCVESFGTTLQKLKCRWSPSSSGLTPKVLFLQFHHHHAIIGPLLFLVDSPSYGCNLFLAYLGKGYHVLGLPPRILYIKPRQQQPLDLQNILRYPSDGPSNLLALQIATLLDSILRCRSSSHPYFK